MWLGPTGSSTPALSRGHGAADARDRHTLVHPDEHRHFSGHQPAGRDGGLELPRPQRGRHGAPAWSSSASAPIRRPLTESSISSRESILGIGVLKVYFQPGTDIGAAIAQIDSVSETILRQAPAGTTAPQIISYNAADVPVAQLNIFSETLSQQQLFDYGLNFMRLQLFTIPGFSSPAPIGGVKRAVIVNLDPKQMYANGFSPMISAIALGHLKRDHSVRHRAHGQFRVQRRHQHEPEPGLPTSTACRSRSSTARRCCWATLRRSPILISRKPTSSESMESRRRT